MRMRSLLILLCSAFMAPPAGALTLIEAQDAASAAAPAVKAALAALKKAEAGLLMASLPDPELSAERVAGGAESELGLSQTFPLSGALAAGRGAARAEIEAAGLETELARAAARAEARKLFHSAAIAAEKARFAEKNAVFALELLNKVEARVLAGRLGNTDLLRARIELDKAGLRQAGAEAEISERRRDLNLLMGRPSGAPLDLEPDADTFLIDGAAAQASAAGRLDLRALEARGRAAALRAKERKRRGSLPDLTVGAASVRLDGETYSRFGVGLSLPLWGGTRGAALEAQSAEDALAAEHEAAALLAAHELAVTAAALDLARRRTQLLRKSLDAAHELRRLAALDYLAGKTQLSDYYEAGRVFLDGNLEYLESVEEYQKAKADHEKAQTAPLAAGGSYDH